LHSNTEKECIDDEGRLPKVPERQTLQTTPTRQSEKTASSPAFNDDISLITMETKGTMYRNKSEGVYTYAEMMRRPPASIIVDGAHIGDDSPMTTREQKEMAPPKIQRLLPQYEKESRESKSKAVEASVEASAKLDSVEARILARRKLREEAFHSEEERGVGDVVKPAEKSDVEMEEEESFVGESKFVDVVDNDLSLMESDGGDGAKENLDTTLVRDNTAPRDDDDGEMRSSIDGPSRDRTVVVHDEGDDKQVVEKAIKSTPLTEEDIPLDELNDSLQAEVDHDVTRAHDAETTEDRPLDKTNETENTFVTCFQSPQAEAKRGVSSISPIESANQIRDAAAASRETEMQLKAMEDEIARLIAEKESRFAAEKAVALKKAEQALEEVSSCMISMLNERSLLNSYLFFRQLL
jgi:hypothetical protein